MRQFACAVLAAMFCLLVAASNGCAPVGMGGVKRGMGVFDVERVMGCEPDRKIYGDGVDADKETHVYKDGRIHYFKKRVVLVEKNRDERTITEKAGDIHEEEGGR